MSTGIRALTLVFPLVVFLIWGSFHTPDPDSTRGYGDDDSDVVLSSLPTLPSWASAELPDFSQHRDSTERKAAFFSFLYPRIMLANSRILIERDYLASLAQKTELSQTEQSWLSDQAQRLRVDEEAGSPELFDRLRKRLDVISPSLILAQAANESAWGTSRFATRGNNLFGQWCFSKGCGLVPLSRVDGASHEVAKFASPYRSVRAYIQNLNRHPTYQVLRDVRLDARNSGELASGTALAAGLIGYSERGEDYVKEIRSMIRYNNLSYFDLAFSDTIEGSNSLKLKQLASTKKESRLLPRSGDEDDPESGS
ncbi:glucosaminidase domain-containing protein [Marinobacter sp.]|uniref:glucosaminidase domain-containing protein n=1 Tax=Marinobacter sp. TaxID=50741 RepID=UPI0034A55AC1